MPRFNKEIKQSVKASLPLAFARPEDPLFGATLLGVLVRDGAAKVDDGVLHGRSDVEKGIRFKYARDEVEPTEVYHVLYVAMKNGPQGMVYQGIGHSELRLDRPNRKGFRDLPQAVNAMSDAIGGALEIGALSKDDVRAVVALLQERGRDVWERTDENWRRRLLEQTGAGR